MILLTFLWQVPRTKRSPEQQGHGTNSAYRRWCGRCGSSSAFLTLIMIHEKEIFPRLPIPSASGLVSLGLSLWFSRERYPFHYTIFFRQIGPAFRQFAPASRQVTSAIGRRGILSLTSWTSSRRSIQHEIPGCHFYCAHFSPFLQTKMAGNLKIFPISKLPACAAVFNLVHPVIFVRYP